MAKQTTKKIEEPAAVEEPMHILEFADTLRELKKHVDPSLVKQREGWRDQSGNVQMVDYVEWHTVADILDDTAPNWAHTIRDVRQIGELMTVTVAITIDGVTREGIGTGIAFSEMGIKKAEHDALKRAAVKFGIARELYQKESEVIEREGSTEAKPDEDDSGFPSNPIARSLGELVTQRQLGMIRALARELKLDPDEECTAVMHCNTDELTKRAASSLIEYFQAIQSGSKQSLTGFNGTKSPYTHDVPGGGANRGKAPDPVPPTNEVDEKRQATEIRKQMETALDSVGISPKLYLEKFDTECKSLVDKQAALAAVNLKVHEKKVEQVNRVFVENNWEAHHILEQLRKFDIKANLKNGTIEQVDGMWRHYIDGRMLKIGAAA